jgi:LuxR family maltose regulon positive regulatory protein
MALGSASLGIDRTSIVQRCINATTSGFVLLEAPAGFGKTHILVQWCERARNTRSTVAWINLRTSAACWRVLAQEMVETLQGSGVRDLPHVPAPTDAVPDSTLADFIAQLSRAIARHRRRILLVLDDYHVIEGGSSDTLLGAMFDRLSNNVVVAIASRRACSLELSRVLLQGRVQRIGAHSLLFSRSEARALFDGSLATGQLSSLYTLTEGWPAALKLAQLCSPKRHKPPTDIRNIPEFSRLLGGYFISEVLRDVKPLAIEFLTQCSITETLEPLVCNAIRRMSDSAQILADLAARETFMEAVDVDANSWQVPRLLRQVLHRRATERTPEFVTSANIRAAVFFETAGRTKEALRHFVAAGEFSAAAACLERATPLVIILTHGDTVGQELLDIIPAAELDKYPRLSLCRAYLDYKRGLLDEARASVSELATRTDNFVKDRPDGNDAKLKTESLCVELVIELYRHSSAPLDDLRRIEQQLPVVNKGDARLIMFIRITLGQLYQIRGDLDAAEMQYIQCQKLNVREQAPWPAVWLLYHGGCIALARGQLMEARYHLYAGLRLWHNKFRSYATYQALVKLALAEIDYETDSLSEAQLKLGEGIYTVEHIEGWFETYASLYETGMMLHWYEGRMDQIEALFARGLAVPRVSMLFERFLPVLRLRFEILRERFDHAQVIVEQHRFDQEWAASTFQDRFTYRERDLLGVSLCHLAIHRRSFNTANHIANRLDEIARAAGQRRTIVKVSVLRSIIADGNGDTESATAHLLGALEVGHASGYRRVFLDEGGSIKHLLDSIGRSAKSSVPTHLATYAKGLCDALQKSDKPRPVGRGAALSERELEVIRELSQGHSNKLIARKLGLSTPTIKYHVTNVFRKFGVRKRAAVVAEAHHRGILS